MTSSNPPSSQQPTLLARTKHQRLRQTTGPVHPPLLH
uniref:Uncharacterized protein n=1 Tax=Anguilla anguilla TaxID=7936 RepID=A0A0E9SHQ9_ANGAN